MTKPKTLIISFIIVLIFSSGSHARTNEKLQNKFEEYKDKIFTLYHNALETQPGFSGRITFKINLNEAG